MSQVYRPHIDGLRALAVLAVVAFHAFPSILRGGFVGVDVFFVISGFIITGILQEGLEKGGPGWAWLKGFYLRRARRIFPALTVVLAASLGVGWLVLLPAEFEQLGRHVAAGVAFVSNLQLWRESGYFDAQAETKPMLHLWSLGVEEQFYLLFPLLLATAFAFRRGRSWILGVPLVASFAVNLWWATVDPSFDFYSPLTRFWELLAGAWLAVLQRQRLLVPGVRTREWLGFGGLTLALAATLLLKRGIRYPNVAALAPVLGTWFLLAAGPGAAVNRRFFSHPWMARIGRMSYPLYLWHWPLLAYAQILEQEEPRLALRVALPCVAVLLAWMTERWVEWPFRFGRWRQRGLAAWVLALVTLGLMGGAVGVLHGVPARQVAKDNSLVGKLAVYGSEPALNCPGFDVPYVTCSLNRGPHSQGMIVLWGDSTAGAWLPVFLDLAKRTGKALTMVEHQSCPPLLGVRKTRFDLPETRFTCNPKAKKAVVDYFRTLKPEVIVLLGAWNSYSSHSHREFLTLESDGEADTRTTREAIAQDVSKTSQELRLFARILIFGPWPYLGQTPIYPIHRLGFLGLRQSKAPVEVPRPEFELDSAEIRAALRGVRGACVHVFEPTTRSCDDQVCRSIVDGIKAYRDGDSYHPSAELTLLYREDLQSALEKLASSCPDPR